MVSGLCLRFQEEIGFTRELSKSRGAAVIPSAARNRRRPGRGPLYQHPCDSSTTRPTAAPLGMTFRRTAAAPPRRHCARRYPLAGALALPCRGSKRLHVSLSSAFRGCSFARLLRDLRELTSSSKLVGALEQRAHGAAWLRRR